MHEPEPKERRRSASTTLAEEPEVEQTATTDEAAPDFSTARALLKHFGTRAGDDLEEVLAEVYATRSKTRF